MVLRQTQDTKVVDVEAGIKDAVGVDAEIFIDLVMCADACRVVSLSLPM